MSLASTPLTVAPGYDKTTAFCDDVDNLFALKCLNILSPTYNVIFSETSDTLLLSICGMEEDVIVSCFRAGKLTESGESREQPRPLIVKLKSKEAALYWSNYGKGWKVEVDSDKAKKDYLRDNF